MSGASPPLASSTSSPSGDAPPSGGRRGWRDGWLTPRRSGWTDVGVALAIAAAYVGLLLGTVDDLGYARDEGFYFVAARAYQGWFHQLWSDPAAALDAVDRTWRVNHEHPAFMKALFALSHEVHRRWGLFAMEGTSFRFPAMALAGLAVGLTYLWGARARGRLVGIVAAGSLACMPRYFFHAHLACFDAPIVALWLLTAYLYWRYLERGGWHGPLLLGLAFGLALNTKHNSWFLPPVLALHALLLQLAHLVARRRGKWDRRRQDRSRLQRRRSLWALAAVATIGPLTFWGAWPWLWHDTVARLWAYAQFHLHHVYYNMEFLGRNYFEPPMPRSYAFVMTVATVPTVTLLAFGVGVVAEVRARFRDGASGVLPQTARHGTVAPEPPALSTAGAPALLWALALVVQYGAWLSTATPIFGGTKHWMTAYPFLALFAGVGLATAASHTRRVWLDGAGRAWARRVGRGPGPELVAAAAVLAAPAVEAISAHPFGLSSYTPLVGGTAGGATLGLNRGFWGYTTGAVTDYLNRAAPRGAKIYVHDTAAPAWRMLIRDGRLRQDLRGVGSVAGADFGLYHHEKHMSGQEYQNWVAFDTARPDHVAGLHGVPVIWVYRAAPDGGDR